MSDVPTATDLQAENADQTRMTATINGKTWRGITSSSRFWPSVQKALDEGASVTAYVPEVEPSGTELALVGTDTYMARVCEDLVDTLVAKGVIALTDLPAAVQSKLAERKTLRGQLP